MTLKEWFNFKEWRRAVRVVLDRPANPTKGNMLLIHTYLFLIFLFLLVKEVLG